MAGKSYKYEQCKGKLGDMVSNACSELEELGSELRDWASGMEGTGLENTEKYSTVSEAADALENINAPDVPKELQEIELSYSQAVNKNKKAGPSRAVRLENACNLLSAVVDHLDGDEFQENQEAQDFMEEVANVRDEVEGVEIPGMFG